MWPRITRGGDSKDKPEKWRWKSRHEVKWSRHGMNPPAGFQTAHVHFVYLFGIVTSHCSGLSFNSFSLLLDTGTLIWKWWHPDKMQPVLAEPFCALNLHLLPVSNSSCQPRQRPSYVIGRDCRSYFLIFFFLQWSRTIGVTDPSNFDPAKVREREKVDS